MDEKQIQVVRGYFSTSEAAYCVASPSSTGGVSKEKKTVDKQEALKALESAAKEAHLFYFDGEFLWLRVAGK
jgi:hypothetical protein